MAYQPNKGDRVGRGFPRIERKRQLIAALLDCHNLNARNGTHWFNTGDLAKMCGLKNTANFRDMLEEMYQEGDMIQQTALHRSNQFKFIWSMATNAPYSKLYRDLIPDDAAYVMQKDGVQMEFPF